MVVMAATFVDLFGDIQNNGKFVSIFFLNYPNRISIFILAGIAGGSKGERTHGNTFYIVILQFVCKIFLTLKWFPFSSHP